MPTGLELSFVKEMKQYGVLIVYIVIIHTQTHCTAYEKAMAFCTFYMVYMARMEAETCNLDKLTVFLMTV